MRFHIVSSRPRLARSKVMLTAASLLLATVTIGATACSGPSGAPVAPSVSPSKSVEPPPPSGTSPTSSPAATLRRSAPVRLQIATIGVDTPLMDLGLGADGTLNVPPGGFPAGWYTGGPTPGEMGPAVIAGHIDMKGPGVFYNLHNVKAGDQVTVTRADGSRPLFRVTLVRQYQKDSFPTRLVYGNLDHAGLRLITCGGTFNSKSGHYEDNLVVFADLAVPSRTS
jgi:LPXTG-site transpeptidase (sortase) family protein